MIIFIILLLLSGGIVIFGVYVYLKSLISPETNKITLYEMNGKLKYPEGILSEKEEVDSFNSAQSSRMQWHFNDPRDTDNYDIHYPLGYILPTTWKTYNPETKEFDIDRKYEPQSYDPNFLEREFNKKFPGAFYFQIEKKWYRNHRFIMELAGKNDDPQEIRPTEQEKKKNPDYVEKLKRTWYIDGDTKYIFYTKTDMSNFLFFEQTYDVAVKVITGISAEEKRVAEAKKKKEQKEKKGNSTENQENNLENLELCLHLLIKVRIRDPKFMMYQSNSMVNEIISELEQVCDDLAVSQNYLSIINSNETGATKESFVGKIISRLDKVHKDPRKDKSGVWHFPTWDLVSAKFINIAGWDDKDREYIRVISSRALKIKQQDARFAEITGEEKIAKVQNRITVARTEAEGDGLAKKLSKVRPELELMITKLGLANKEVLEKIQDLPDPNQRILAEKIAEASENFKGAALTINMGGGSDQGGTMNTFAINNDAMAKNIGEIVGEYIKKALLDSDTKKDSGKKDDSESKKEESKDTDKKSDGGNKSPDKGKKKK